MKLQWLGQVRVLGALDTDSTAQIKALLVSFNTTDGQNCVSGYGTQPGDVDPSAWGTRDGDALVCFVTWWTAHKATALPDPKLGPKAEHLQALLQWSVEKASQNQPPPNCALACQQKYANDPQNLKTCLAICGVTPPPPPAQPPPEQIPPLPPPPAPINQPPSSSTSSSMGGWVVAGLLALAIGIGALALGGSPQRTK